LNQYGDFLYIFIGRETSNNSFFASVTATATTTICLHTYVCGFMREGTQNKNINLKSTQLAQNHKNAVLKTAPLHCSLSLCASSSNLIASLAGVATITTTEIRFNPLE